MPKYDGGRFGGKQRGYRRTEDNKGYGGSNRYGGRRTNDVVTGRGSSDDTTILNNVWISFPDDYVLRAKNGARYIVYHVYKVHPDKARSPSYRGFLFESSTSQLRKLAAVLCNAMSDDNTTLSQYLSEFDSIDDSELFNAVLTCIGEAIESGDIIPVKTNIVVRQDEQGYTRVFLCTPYRVAQLSKQHGGDSGEAPTGVGKDAGNVSGKPKRKMNVRVLNIRRPENKQAEQESKDDIPDGDEHDDTPTDDGGDVVEV